jgi:cytochrome c oxidase cbb3-type subunit 3
MKFKKEDESMSEEHCEEVVNAYDGIQELDNSLPRWWLWLFYIAIIFGVVFFGYYHLSGKGMLAGERFKAQGEGAGGSSRNVTTVAAVPATDAPTLAQGQKIYMTHCVACHTPTGAGLVGPNMTDAYWLHGATFDDSIRVVTTGIPEKGMISWAPILPPDDIHAVSSYVFSLRGTNPPNPKEPQGEWVEGSDRPTYAPLSNDG